MKLQPLPAPNQDQPPPPLERLGPENSTLPRQNLWKTYSWGRRHIPSTQSIARTPPPPRVKSHGLIRSHDYAEYQLSRLPVLVSHACCIPKTKAVIARREPGDSPFTGVFLWFHLYTDKSTTFAMARTDWMTIGGPQAGKLSRIPVSRTAIYTRSVALLRDFLRYIQNHSRLRFEAIIVVYGPSGECLLTLWLLTTWVAGFSLDKPNDVALGSKDLWWSSHYKA